MADHPGVAEGLRIHRNHEMKDWAEQLDRLPEDLKEGAAEYLRAICTHYRSLVEMARSCGCRSMREFDELKKAARRAGAPSARAWFNAGRPEQWRNG